MSTREQLNARDEQPAGELGDESPLLSPASDERYRSTWESIQVGFVD